MKNIFIKLAFAVLFTVYGLQGLKAQTITSFSPASGPIGTSVTLTGTGFNATAANNIVFFGATMGTVTGGTGTTGLTVTVPAGATYQPISVLNTANGLTAYSAKPFVTTFTPSKGAITTADMDPKVDLTISGANLRAIAIGDLNGDGKSDIVVANIANNTISIFKNISVSGTLTASSFAAKVDFAANSNLNSVAIGDIDGDGKPDIVMGQSGFISVLRNLGNSDINTSSFAARVDFNVGSLLVRRLAINDLDGDGKPELAFTSLNTASLSIMRNTSTVGSINSSSFATRVDFPSGFTQASGLAVGDMDNDGKPDIAITTFDGSNGTSLIHLYRNTTVTGTITAASFTTKFEYTTASNPVNVVIGDIDGDGKPDMTVGVANTGVISVLRNTISAPGSFNASSFAAKLDLSTRSAVHDTALGDFDGDGKLDVAATDNFYGNALIFRNTSTSGVINAASFAARLELTTTGSPYAIAVGDLDGDGKPDITTANNNNGTITILRNNNVLPVISAAGALSALTTTAGTASATTSFTLSGTNMASGILVTPPAGFQVSSTSATTGFGSTVTVGAAGNIISTTIYVRLAAASPANTYSGNIVLSAASASSVNVAIPASRVISIDAGLSNLSVSAGALSPTFATATTAYTLNVGNSISTVTITPTTSDANATVKINGIAVVSGSASNAISLNVGNNTITTLVTAEDGTTTKTYTVNVYRLSADAGLTNLSVSAGALSPAFATATTAYTLNVGNGISTVTITPTTSNANATVKINGIAVASGSASNAISLNVGNNTITTLVTAEDVTTTKTYTVTIYRAIPADAVVPTNLLSPNGDGKNDTWIVKDIQLYPNNVVTIFDRAGREVYSKRGYNNDWDGTLSGAPLTQGTYYYTVNLGPGTSVIKGFITILRSR